MGETNQFVAGVCVENMFQRVLNLGNQENFQAIAYCLVELLQILGAIRDGSVHINDNFRLFLPLSTQMKGPTLRLH